jgi:hypothetical protein
MHLQVKIELHILFIFLCDFIVNYVYIKYTHVYINTYVA